MAPPETVVVDTSAFYALISGSDDFHKRAVTSYEQLLDRDVDLWTTSYALVETIALVHRRLGYAVLSELLPIIETNINLFWVESTLHSMAMAEFTPTRGRGLSLVDWTVVLVARIKSAHVFTFDRRLASQAPEAIPSV